MAKSLADFGTWGLQMGQVANPDGSYPGQCVSLVQQYLDQVFGIPYAPRGNAKDFVPPTFTQVYDAPRPGDIIRYGANYGGGYGHIGLIDVNGKWYDQNGVKSLAVGYQNSPFASWDSVWRPTKPFDMGGGSAPAPAPAPDTSGLVPQNATFVAYGGNNIRRAPSLSGEIVAQLAAGETVQYDSYIDAEGYRWISYIGYSGNRNYVARRTTTEPIEYFGDAY